MREPPNTRRTDARGIDRRTLLASAGVASSLALAGCSGLLGDDGGGYDRSQADFDPEIPPYDEVYPDDDGITMFRGGSRRLGYYPAETVPDAVSVNWALPINYVGHTAAKSSPVPTADGETVVIPADTGRVHAVSPRGEHRWVAETRSTLQGFHASPVIVDGVAYVGGYDGAVGGQNAAMYAFDVETGETIWRNDDTRGAVAIGSSAAYWDGNLYVIAEHRHPEQKGTLWVFDAETGEGRYHEDRIDGMPHPTVAVDPATERLVTGSNDGLVYCWEFPSLEFEWTFETGGEVKGPIPTYEGGAFVGSWDGNVYRVSLADGTEEWSFPTGDVVMSAPAVDPETGIVYVGSDDRHVYALEADTGDEVWSADLGGRVMGALSVTADAVLAGTTAADLYALEKDSGDVRWRVDNRGAVTSEPVPRDGRIYYAERGHISNYDPGDPSGEDEVVEAPGHAYCLVADD